MKKYIIANWKMNPQTIEDAEQLARTVNDGIEHLNQELVEVVVCPPFPFLNLKSEILNLKLGAQNCFWENEGSYTGEVSPLMLKEIGCEYVILGHSERRVHLDETDEMIAKKVQAALDAGLKVVLCVGENIEERKVGQTRQVLERQLEADLNGILNLKSPQQNKFATGQAEILNLLIAYEPIWAVSGFNGHAASAQTTNEATNWIRAFLEEKFGEEGRVIPVLYGGSINAKNAKEHVCDASTDGFLVGSASLDAEEFIRIVESVQCK